MIGNAFQNSLIPKELEIVKIGYLLLDIVLQTIDPGTGKFIAASVMQSVAHGLSFTPTVISFFQEVVDPIAAPNNIWAFEMAEQDWIGAPAFTWRGFFIQEECWADDKNIYYERSILASSSIQANISPADGIPINLKYFLLKARKN